jgi:hypothetical protein
VDEAYSAGLDRAPRPEVTSEMTHRIRLIEIAELLGVANNAHTRWPPTRTFPRLSK